VTLEYWTDMLSRNVGSKLPNNTATHLNGTKISTTGRRKQQTAHVVGHAAHTGD